MADSPLKQLRKDVECLKPCDRFFHIVIGWPFPHEHDDKDPDNELWPSSVVQDVLGTGDIL